MHWFIWLIVSIIILLFIIRFVLIAYAKTIPNTGEQEPYIIANDDVSKYHASKQWLNYKTKCNVLCTQSKQSEIRMYKRNTNTYRNKEINNKNRLNFNTLKNVICINIDEKCMYADVEGSITFDTFTAQLLKYGYIPTVVPELKSITVGGSIVGGGIESSSFKYGLVHESMLECDVLLANGNVITCNNNPHHKYSDLFKAIPNSLGSLGYILRVRMKIIKCKKYVALGNISCKDHDSLADSICDEASSNKSIDFIEGVAYWNGTGRILMGTMINNIPSNKTLLDPSIIFHKYINNIQNGDTELMIMTINDYLWRWDSDLFWCLEPVKFLNNKWIRWFVGPHIMRSDVLRHFHKIIFKRDIIIQNKKQKDAGNEMYIQDIIVPQKNVRNWLKFHFEEVLYLRKGENVHYPLWLCPTKGNENDYTLMCVNDKTINVNFGFWSTVEWDKPIKLNKFVENNLSKYGALKILYSIVLFEKQQFYDIYNGKEYFKLKAKYDKDNKIRGLYEKCTKK